MLKNFFKKIFSLIIIFVLVSINVSAADLTSSNFIIRDPIVGTGGSFSSSTNFKLLGSGHTSFSGNGSSSSFLGRYGFLYFPYVKTGTLTAVQDGIDADLSWVASSSGLGWNVSGYKTGMANVSGGPYSYTSVSNVTSYSYTNLTPGLYCFVVQTLDAFNNVIGTSNESCVTIAPVLVFDIDTSVADGETSSPYNVALGTITTSDARVSGSTDNINMIILEGLTNAPNGVVVNIKNTNGSNGLVSTSAPADNINSVDGTISTGSENYGLCVITTTLSGFVKSSPYNTGSCATNSNTNDIQGLTNTGESILNSNSTVLSSGHAEISVNASIGGNTPAHDDYIDTLTFTATSTF